MITFDLIALLMTILIVVILLFFGIVWKLLDDIKEWQKSQYKKLDFINTQIAGIWQGQDQIENNVAILSSIVDKMHRNLCVEIADKSANVTPCYAPENIRKWDCINCTKKSTCDRWTTNTSIKAEDAPLQERFNNNKED